MKRGMVFTVAIISSVVLQVTGSAADDVITLTKPPEFGAIMSGRIYPPAKSAVERTAMPITPETVLNAVDARIRALFDRAADPSTHLVTIESANRAGVGYFVDNFALIDRDQDGSLRYSEVKGFFDAQSPIKRPASKEIQIIE